MSESMTVEQERDKWQEIASRWLAVSNDQALVIDALKQERDELLSRLPDGMKHCTIVFKECEKGHGWLTAANWVQHGCPTCERDELRRRVEKAEESLSGWRESNSGKAIAKIKAEAVREACDKVVGNYRMCHEGKSGNVYLNIIALRDYADRIEGGE